jgi:hypothetical protein
MEHCGRIGLTRFIVSRVSRAAWRSASLPMLNKVLTGMGVSDDIA